MLTKPFRAYTGDDPYVFVCYAHADSEAVYRELSELSDAGIPIWYDEGIEPSAIWSDSLAHAIEGCSLFLYYLTPQSARSEYCRREINFAMDLGLRILVTVIEPTELSAGMKLLLGTRQAILRHELNPDAYWDKLQRGIFSALQHTSQSAAARPSPPPQARQWSGDRRLITVLNADLVSGPDASWPDPDDWAECVQAFQALCEETVSRFEARIAQHTGDGVIAYFGHPVAHENDAERAVRCAMTLQTEFPEALARLDTEGEMDVQLRLSVNSGPVVIDPSTHLATGPTPILASRMLELNVHNRILVSSSTLHLVQNRFEAELIGEQRLPGFGEPVAVHMLIRQLPDTGTRIAPDTPFVGRHIELAQLSALLDRSRGGSAMFGLIRGEPGIGKTRLVYEFSNRARGLTHYWLTIHCSPFDAGAPFDPLISALSRNMGLDGVDDPGERSRLFDAGAQRHELDRQEQRAALAELLAVDVDKKLNCTTAQKRRLMIEALSKTLISPTTLTILHFEDIHWLDPSSLEVLEYIFSKGSKFPLLVLMTARPEFELPVSWKGMVLTINVERLLDADVRDLVGAMVESPAAVEELASRSDGIPLFAEALAKTHSESSRSSASVPQSLQELLYQSLDRLGDAKQIAQIAAVFGREFEVSQLLDVLDIGRHSLELQLAKLADSGLVFTSSPGHYVFKHALVQQLAYDSIPKRARRDLHLQIGELIADTRGDSVGPHVLAIHFSRARQHARAAELWLDAGRLAFRRSAYVEAANYLRTALEELPGIADELARDKQEITIQTYLGETLSALEGFAARSTQRAFERARELSEARNLTEEMFRAVSRLVGVAFVHSHNSHAHSLSSELQNIAKSMNDVRAMADADTLSGITAYQAGRFEEASDYFSRAVNYLISEQKSGSLMTAASHADAYQINTLWFLGKPDSAIRHAEAALARARSPAHPFNEAAVLMCLGVTRALRGEAELCRQVAFDLEALAREHNFMLHLGNAQCLLGMALSLGDDVERGIDELRMGLDTFDSLGQLAYATFYQSYLAGAYLRTDQLAHAESVLERTLDHAEEMGVNICTPELLRLTAELRLAQGEHQQADALLRRALALCDQQAARGAGLRVAISRLQAFPDVSDLRNDLKARLASFDEGLDTQDLRVAAQLVV